MKSQDEIRAEIDRLLDADRVEEAAALVDQLEPVSLEEFERRLAEAPYEDELAAEGHRTNPHHATLAERRAPYEVVPAEDEILSDIRRLLDEDRFDEADALVELLEPVSEEEFRRRLDEAPYDDEPCTEADRAAFDRARRAILSSYTRQAR